MGQFLTVLGILVVAGLLRLSRATSMAGSARVLLCSFASLAAVSCTFEPAPKSTVATGQSGAAVVDSFAARRDAMVRHQIQARGIKSPAVLQAMRTIPRH